MYMCVYLQVKDEKGTHQRASIVVSGDWGRKGRGIAPFMLHNG